MGILKVKQPMYRIRTAKHKLIKFIKKSIDRKPHPWICLFISYSLNVYLIKRL